VSPTAVLAEFASGLHYADIPTAVLEHAKTCILDTLGCGLYGSSLPWCQAISAVVREEGGQPVATLWGTAQRGSPTQAALANGTAGHGFEMDDLHHAGGIHPGALTVPAALALAERQGADGRALLAAVVAGYEVGARVGMAVGIGHFRAGYHPQGTVGVFAAAAAAGHLLGLNREQLVHALGIAGSQAAGLMAAQGGSMVKRMHSGRAAQSGVYAALLAQRGFTGIVDVLEAEFGGFLGTMGGGKVVAERLTHGLGSTWETASVGFKAYASCSAVHTSLDIAGRLRTSYNFRPEDVDTIRVHTSTHTFLHCGWPYQPVGITAAQMNVQYGMARMLMDGEVSVDQFTEEAIRDPRALDLASRISVVPDESIDALGSDLRHTTRVRLVTRDGRTVEDEAQQRTGSALFPLTRADIDTKFRRLAGSIVGLEQAEALRQAVLALDTLPSVALLAPLLAKKDGGPRG
jgi:2-methylcitrate dehydratase PrpD